MSANGVEMHQVGANPHTTDVPNPNEDGEVEKGHSFFSAVFNFVNSIVGAGIIGLAFALEHGGLGMGLLMLILTAIVTGYSVDLLVRTGVRENIFAYEGLCYKLFGSWGFYICSLCMWMFATGAMLAYLVIIGDTVPVVLHRFTGVAFFATTAARFLIVTLCAILICFPLSAMKDIGNLGKTSFVSIVAVVMIVAISAIRAPVTADKQGIHALEEQTDEYAFIHPHFPEAFGAICFAFVCQHSSFLVRNSLRKPEQWPLVVVVSIAIASILCVVLAGAGYLSFLRCTRPNILNNLDADDDAANVARLMLALTMFLTYPMEFFVARQVVQSALIQWSKSSGPISPLIKPLVGDSYDSNPYGTPDPNTAHWPITIVQFLLTLFCGLFVDLGLLLEFTGAFAGVALGFVLPGACYLKQARDSKLSSSFWVTLDKTGSWLLVIVGIVAMCVSTFFNVRNIISEPAMTPEWCPSSAAH